FEFWTDLQQNDPGRYQHEKHRVAEAVIAVLERSVADIRQAIEVIDVSTPATVIRHTGNWQGSMEGWLLTPNTGFRVNAGEKMYQRAGVKLHHGGVPNTPTGRLLLCGKQNEKRIASPANVPETSSVASPSALPLTQLIL